MAPRKEYCHDVRNTVISQNEISPDPFCMVGDEKMQVYQIAKLHIACVFRQCLIVDLFIAVSKTRFSPDLSVDLYGQDGNRH